MSLKERVQQQERLENKDVPSPLATFGQEEEQNECKHKYKQNKKQLQPNSDESMELQMDLFNAAAGNGFLHCVQVCPYVRCNHCV